MSECQMSGDPFLTHSVRVTNLIVIIVVNVFVYIRVVRHCQYSVVDGDWTRDSGKECVCEVQMTTNVRS